MSELLDVFIGESRENLESASQKLLALQSEGYQASLVDNVFRDLHTIKGSSDLFPIKPLTRLAHAAEDLLDSVRAGETAFNQDLGDILFEAFDQISAWFDELESGNDNADGWITISQALSERLRKEITGANSQVVAQEADSHDDAEHSQCTEAKDGDTGSTPLLALPEETACTHLATVGKKALLRAMKLAVGAETDQQAYVQLMHYTPDKGCFFSGEDPVNVVAALPHRQTIVTGMKQEHTDDVFNCFVTFTTISVSTDAALAKHMDYYQGQYQSWSLPVWSCATYLKQEIVDALQRDGAEALREALANLDEENVGALADFMLMSINHTDIDYLLFRWIVELCALHCDLSPLAELAGLRNASVASTSTSTATDNEILQDTNGATDELSHAAITILKQQRILLESVIHHDGGLFVLPSVETVITRVLNLSTAARHSLTSPQLWLQHINQVLDAAESPDIASADIASSDVESATQATPESPILADNSAEDTNAPSTQEEAGKAKQERQVPKVLKVNQEKVDYLMDLIGELTVAKNTLPYLAKQADDEGARKLSKQIKGHFTIVNRLTEELQSAVLQIRMVPVSHVFQRYPRLVRDLARKLTKKIDLVMQGEDTEFDKNLIESLSEPLIHLLRNSIDHGIESPQERLAQGKPEAGVIHLSATPNDDSVVIEIRDDGKGIDPHKIKLLAYQKGIITESQLESIDDQEALHLIFAPGFSTSETVSDLSGRGVGMDAVKTMVMQAGGTIEMDSTVGEGSVFRLILPQTMSINRVMMFELNNQMFGVGMDSVVETVKAAPKDIQFIRNHQVLMLRDKLIPLHCLRTLLHMAPPHYNNEDDIPILVVNTGQGEFGLMLDRFHEGIDVIQKPLEGVMAGFNQFAGTALLGDGRVLLILNIQELVACQ